MNYYKILLVLLVLTSNICSMYEFDYPIDYTKAMQDYPLEPNTDRGSLVSAAYQGDLKATNKFVQELSINDINETTEMLRGVPSWNALMAATVMGNVEVVNVLLLHGADPKKAINKYDFSKPLVPSKPYRSTPEFFKKLSHPLRELIRRDDAVFIAEWASQNAPTSAERENYKKILELLKKGPSKILPKTPSKQPETPKTPPTKPEQPIPIKKMTKEEATHFLLQASKENNIEKIKQALAQGDDINAQDEDGSTPLILSVSARSPKAVQLLLDNGANVNIADNQGWTPLMHIIARASYSSPDIINIIKILLDHSADVITIKNSRGQTAWDMAQNALPEIQTLLTNARDKQHYASFNQNITNLVNTLDTLQSQLTK